MIRDHAVTRRLLLVVGVTIAVCVGCSSIDVQTQAARRAATQASMPNPDSKGARELQRGLESYDNGDYRTAEKRLHAALALGLATAGERANAHKNLAFIACASGREGACREQFRLCLEEDPTFELSAAESGHPIWGPMFRSLKAQLSATAKPK